jgi:hypothetical protein
MQRRYAVAAVVAVALVAAGGASSDPSPPPDPTTGVTSFLQTNQQRPVAGRYFTGLVITDTSTVPDHFTAYCGKARLGKRQLQVEQTRVSGDTLTSIACGWHVPKGSAGRRLRLTGAAAYLNNGAESAPVYFWRVRR